MRADIPETVSKEEELGRGISSSKNARRALRSRVPFTEFLPPQGKIEISVDRLSVASLRDVTAVADARDKGRDRSFYGWAVVRAEVAASNGRRVVASPIEGINPYHGDIVLPPYPAYSREKQKRHAQELADLSSWREHAIP